MKRTSSPTTTAIVSPCIRVCELDADQTCIGCRRTLDEIGAWSGASESEKLEILQRIKQRAAAG